MVCLYNKSFSVDHNKSCDVWIAEIKRDENREQLFMVSGYEVAEFLGYKLPEKAIRDRVNTCWRRSWEQIKGDITPLMTSPAALEMPHKWQLDTVFITEPGVCALIMRSPLPEAAEFHRWLFEEVLPELRRTGKYAMGGSSNGDVVNYDARLAEMRIRVLEEQLARQSTVAKYDATIAELKRVSESTVAELKRVSEGTVAELKFNHEIELSKYREREYNMRLAMKDMATQANMSLTQFAVNALLAKDNIDENEQLRNTLSEVKDRIVPALTETPHKEEYITGYERTVNGKRRIRMCRSQLSEVEQQDKAIERYRNMAAQPVTRKKAKQPMSKRYAWMIDSNKFLQLKCPNPVAVWLKVRSERPHLFYGLRYTNKLRTEVEVLDEAELREKYQKDVDMCERNKCMHSKMIEEFKSLNLENEDSCVARCLTPSEQAKERINAIIDDILKNMNSELIPATSTRTHSNAGDVYTTEQVVHTMNNYQNYFVKNVFNIQFNQMASPPKPVIGDASSHGVLSVPPRNEPL